KTYRGACKVSQTKVPGLLFCKVQEGSCANRKNSFSSSRPGWVAALADTRGGLRQLSVPGSWNGNDTPTTSFALALEPGCSWRGRNWPAKTQSCRPGCPPPHWSSPPRGARSKHGSRSRGQHCPAGHRHPHQRGPERQNCVDAYPTFLVVLWSAGLLCSQVPAAFAGLMYLFVRQKYFVGYLGERTQSTPGYIFGKRIILFLFLMSLAGIFNYYLILFFGSDFENYIKAVTTTISPLLLIP
uniref:Arachidonate 5-lipoxygenase-activating protein n=1 Tax=Ailuropoda melanoleuca TaxID=9646 RepID=A0A7N5JUY5_AILME